MNFLVFYTKDFSDEFDDLISHEIKAPDWAAALKIAEATALARSLELDSIERQS